MRYGGLVGAMLAVAAGLALASWAIQYRMAETAGADTGEALTAVVELTRQAIRSWVKEQRSDAEVWAKSPAVRRSVAALRAGVRDPVALAAAPAQAALRALLTPVSTTKGYQGFSVIGPDDAILASSRDDDLGRSSPLVAQAGFLERVRAGEAAMSLPRLSGEPLPGLSGELKAGQPTLFVAAPLRDEAGGVIAVLAIRIDPTSDFSEILQQGRIGSSGETYAFDRQGRMISESRFKRQLTEIGLLEPGRATSLGLELRDPGVDLLAEGSGMPLAGDRPLTRMAESAVARGSGVDVEGYRDYRGVTVVGAWVWDEALGMGFATEVDHAEAFESLAANRVIVTLGTVLIAALLAVLTAIFVLGRERKTASLEVTSKQTVLSEVLETVDQGVAMFDSSRRLMVWNRRYQEMLEFPDDFLRAGLSNREMAEHLARRGAFGEGPVDTLVEDRLRLIWGSDATDTEIVIRGDKRYETLIRHKDDGGVVISYSDITAREQARAEIAAQRDQLDQLNRQKSKLFSIIAHDLRTPLNSVLGFSRLIATKQDRLDREQVAQYAETIHDSASALHKLLEDLLAWARAQMDNVRFEPSEHPLPELVEDGIDALRGSARAKGVTLAVEVPERSVTVDREMIVTVIRNLVSNAIKFTHGGGRVAVSARPESDSLVVTVSDSGVGMPPEQIDAVLNAGTGQSTIGTAGETGSGLGLLLCKEFIQKHGGAMAIESEPGRGTSFSFALPGGGPAPAE